MKDILFLLAPGFIDGDGPPYYCPYCTIFEGLLHLFPNLATQLDVRRIAFSKPRAEIVSLLGSENQSCPVLVVRGEPKVPGNFKTFGEFGFIDDPEEIGNYLSLTYGIPRPH